MKDLFTYGFNVGLVWFFTSILFLISDNQMSSWAALTISQIWLATDYFYSKGKTQ